MALQIGSIDLVASQLAEVQARLPEARIESAPDGQRLLAVPDLPLPPGWSKDRVTLRTLVPVGFPHVKPDCFYTDPDLRLANGAEPGNTAIQAVFGAQYRWFSYHLASWDPPTGSIDQYVRFCHRRLHEVR